MALQEVPFPPDAGSAAPSKPLHGRSVHMTVERTLRFKETPGCTARLV